SRVYPGVQYRQVRSGNRCGDVLAGDVRIVQSRGNTAAIPGRMVDGGIAANGARRGACGRGCAARGSRTRNREEDLSMKCPFCAHLDDKVIDSREARTGDLVRRRRECIKCGRRFTTYERIDEIPYMVIKKDGRREKFERQKILQGLLKACEKRPVPVVKLESIVDEAEAFVSEANDRERTTTEIGELLMNRLKKL